MTPWNELKELARRRDRTRSVVAQYHESSHLAPSRHEGTHGIYTKMPLTQQKLLPISPKQVAQSIRREHRHLSDSDVHCLVKLHELGKLDVSLDRVTRRVVIAPEPDVTDFVNSVFGLTDQHAEVGGDA